MPSNPEDLASPHARRLAVLLPTVALLLALNAGSTMAIDPPHEGAVPPRLDQPETTRDPVLDLPADFSDTVMFEGLTSPTSVAFAPDGRVFVAEKSGRIRVFDDEDDTTASTWADLRTKVHNYWDRGLLGMALDPAFASNGRVYVAYAHDAAIGGTAPRWGSAGMTGDPCPNPPGGNSHGCVISGRVSALTSTGPGTVSEQVLVEDWCQQFPSHSMADVEFGPDGALYVSAGEGASFNTTDGGDWGQFGYPDLNPCGDPPAGVGGTQTQPSAEGGALRAQDLRTTADPTGLSGSVIRIDPATGNALSSNPGSGVLSSNTKRIVAYGLRNPFRIALHPENGELWIGDVGWNTWEEINRHGSPTAAVRNFGWPCREGSSGSAPGAYGGLTLCQTISGTTAPFLTYHHDSQTVAGDGCDIGEGSTSGLAFYGGGDYPAAYDGALFLADYARGCIWVMFDTDGNGVPEPGTLTHFADAVAPVDLTVAPDGDIVYVDIGLGQIRRIGFAPNGPPVADLDATPTGGPVPLEVDFDASGSSDPDGDPLSFAWDLDGDGSFDDGTGPTATRTYTQVGSVTVRVRVRDPDLAQDVASVTIQTGNTAPTATISQPTTSTTWAVGAPVTYAGSGTDPEQGALPGSAFTWTLILHHCPSTCHAHEVESWSGTTSGQFPAVDHDYPSHLELRLRVEDEHGASDEDSVTFQPQTVVVTVASSPTGLQVSAGSTTGASPVSITVIRNGSVGIAADPLQALGTRAYRFAGWSHGGATSHAITASATATYTAVFDLLFADVGTSIFLEDIAWLAGEGITGGCATGPPRFCPADPVTRAQMASFLVRALDIPAASADPFTDDEGSIHEADINALAAAGITKGCTATRFCPSSPVTREQMSAFLRRGLD